MKIILVHEYRKSINGEIELSHVYERDSVIVGSNIINYPIDDKTIQIAQGYDDGFYPITYNHICSDDTKVISNIPKEKSLYKTYSSNNLLKENNKYTIKLKIDNNDYTKEIYSKFNPLYSTIDKIRNDTGDLLKDIPDNTIYKFIHQNSKIAYEFIYDSESTEEVVITQTVKEYVRYKTDLDLVNSVYLSMTQQYGKVKKTISSLDIEYEHKLPIISDMLQYFKEKVGSYEDELINKSSSNLISTFVKANSTEYSISARNSF